MTETPEWIPSLLVWLWFHQEYGWAVALFFTVLVLGAVFFWLSLRREDEDSRAGLARWVRRRGWRNAYKSSVVWLLDQTDHWFLTQNQRGSLPLTSLRRAFSTRLLDRAMLWAVLYPFLLLTLQWTYGGGPGTIGPLVVIPAEPRDWVRLGTVGGLSALFMLTRWLLGNHVRSKLVINIGRFSPRENLVGRLALVTAFAAAVAAAAATLAMARFFDLSLAVQVLMVITSLVAIGGSLQGAGIFAVALSIGCAIAYPDPLRIAFWAALGAFAGMIGGHAYSCGIGSPPPLIGLHVTLDLGSRQAHYWLYGSRLA